MRTLVALAITVAALLFAPAAHADSTCTFASPVIIISLFAPVTLVCGDNNDITVNHTTSVQIDPSLLGRAP
jgi:hypothetical protein